jgi:hypothetical protein
VTTPTRLQRALSSDSIDPGINFRLYPADEQSIRVDLAGLRPTAPLAADGHARLIAIENLDAGAGHHIAKPGCLAGWLLAVMIGAKSSASALPKHLPGLHRDATFHARRQVFRRS